MTDPNGPVVRVFSAKACAAPLRKAAKAFEEKTGIYVDIDVCARHCATRKAEEADAESGTHDFLIEIAEDEKHDLAISGAEYLLDDGEIRGIVIKGERRTIASRRSAIIVPAGNPKAIQSIEDLTAPGIRVAVSAIDCLKGLWEDVAARLRIMEALIPNITYHASGCVAIVEAVAEREVDAGFGWTAFKHLEPDRIDLVELPPEQEIWRGTGVGLLTFSKNPEGAKQFMDFLTTPEARAVYVEYGWVV